MFWKECSLNATRLMTWPLLRVEDGKSSSDTRSGALQVTVLLFVSVSRSDLGAVEASQSLSGDACCSEPLQSAMWEICGEWWTIKTFYLILNLLPLTVYRIHSYNHDMFRVCKCKPDIINVDQSSRHQINVSLCICFHCHLLRHCCITKHTQVGLGPPTLRSRRPQLQCVLLGWYYFVWLCPGICWSKAQLCNVNWNDKGLKVTPAVT